MKRVNLCAASIPHTPCALTRALAHALRQSAPNVIDARLTQLTQGRAVRAKLTRGPSVRCARAPRGSRAEAGSFSGLRASTTRRLKPCWKPLQDWQDWQCAPISG